MMQAYLSHTSSLTLINILYSAFFEDGDSLELSEMNTISMVQVASKRLGRNLYWH